DILRANAAADILSENEFKKERVCLTGRGGSRKKAMNNWATDKSVWLVVAAILFSSSRLLFGGPDPLATDGKDYSKEVVPVKKSWCETPSLWEIRIGAPGWLAGVSGESGVKGVVGSSDFSFDQLLTHLTHVPIVLSADIRY